MDRWQDRRSDAKHVPPYSFTQRLRSMLTHIPRFTLDQPEPWNGVGRSEGLVVITVTVKPEYFVPSVRSIFDWFDTFLSRTKEAYYILFKDQLGPKFATQYDLYNGRKMAGRPRRSRPQENPRRYLSFSASRANCPRSAKRAERRHSYYVKTASDMGGPHSGVNDTRYSKAK